MNTTSNPSLPWYTQFRPHVNDKRVNWEDLDLTFAGGKCKLELEYKYSYLIGGVDGFIALEYQPGQEGQGLVFDPPLGQLVEMAKGTTSLSWTITADEAACGSFVLQFALPKNDEMSKSPPVKFEMSKLEQELEVKFDEFPVSFGASAYPCHGAQHTFTVLPTPGSRLLNKKIRLLMEGENLGVDISPSPENEQLLTLEGVTWELNCQNTAQNGNFSLLMMSVESGVKTSPLDMLLAHNFVTAERWSVERWKYPDIVWYTYHIRATSFFLKKPVSGVQVTLAGAGEPSYGITDSAGEVMSLTGGSSILNRYNGIVV